MILPHFYIFWFLNHVTVLPIQNIILNSKVAGNKQQKRGTSVTPTALHLIQAQSPLVFIAQSCGDVCSWHWNPVWSGDPSRLVGEGALQANTLPILDPSDSRPPRVYRADLFHVSASPAGLEVTSFV